MDFELLTEAENVINSIIRISDQDSTLFVWL
jgi:hypothetical protein